MQPFILASDQIRPLDPDGPPFAHIDWSNPIADGPIADGPPSGPLLDAVGAAPRIVLFSGWFGDDADPRAGRFPRDFRTWTPTAWDALDRFCDQIRPVLEARGTRIAFRPHARHILADPQACLTFLRRREEQPFEILLDPAGFLTPEMLPRAEDHLTRAFDALVGHPAIPAVLLSGVAPQGDGLRPVPLTQSAFDPGLLLTLARRRAADLPWIVLEDDLERQLALLHSA